MTRDLLWYDSRAGLVAGGFMLALSGWLSPWFGLPRELLWVMGAANVGYGLFSGWLYRQQHRPRGAIMVLVLANGAWAMACLMAAYHYAPVASVFGEAQLIGEGLIVGALAALEWRARTTLQVR